MFVDGDLATVSYNVDDRGARPYACMDYSESIELLKAESYVQSTAGIDSQDADWNGNLDPTTLTSQMDEAILNLLRSGKSSVLMLQSICKLVSLVFFQVNVHICR